MRKMPSRTQTCSTAKGSKCCWVDSIRFAVSRCTVGGRLGAVGVVDKAAGIKGRYIGAPDVVIGVQGNAGDLDHAAFAQKVCVQEIGVFEDATA
jgi:hypothetical protein